MSATDFIPRAKEAGFTDEEINGYVSKVGGNAISAGFSQQEVMDGFGIKDVDADAFRSTFQQNIDNWHKANSTGEGQPPKELSISDAFNIGFSNSNTGLMTSGKLPQELPPNAPGYQKAIASVGQFYGDAPFIIGGSVVGAIGAAETGPFAPFVGGAMGFGLNESIRQSLIDTYKNGQFKDFSDFYSRVLPIAWETAKAATLGAVMPAAGGMAEQAAVNALAKPVATKAISATTASVAQTTARLGAEYGSMVEVGSLLNGHIPTAQDFEDGAWGFLGVIAGVKVAGKSAEAVGAAKSALMETFVKTGTPPDQVIVDAKSNPSVAESIVNGKVPEIYTRDQQGVNGAVTAQEAQGETFSIPAGEIADRMTQEFGGDATSLLEAGRVKIVSSVEELNKATGGEHPEDVQAMYDPVSDSTYIVADNMEPNKVKGVVLHDVGVHAGMEEMLGQSLFNRLKAEVRSRADKGEGVFVEARDAVPKDTHPDNISEETLAYMVENNPDHPFVQRLLARVRAWAWRKFDLARNNMTLTDADISALAAASLRQYARKAARASTRGGTPYYSQVNQTDSQKFKDWFGDSKVVDENGKPLTVYHGTARDFYAFNTHPDNQLGSHFSSAYEVANHFAESDQGGRVHPVYLNLKNPLDIGSDLGDWSDMESLKEYLGPDNYEIFDEAELADLHTPSDVVKALEQKGYDGIAYNNYFEGERSGVNEEKSYIAFHPEQIKSATGNNGEFSPTNPDIRYSRTKQEEGKEVPRSIDEKAIIESAVKFAASKQFPTNRDFKVELQDQINKAAKEAGVDLANFSAKTEEYLHRMALSEGRSAMETNANAVGWYNEKVTKALNLVSLVHPEIATDPESKFAFVWSLAVTSNGLKVDKNFELAEEAYSRWKASSPNVLDRRMPIDIGIGTAAGPINNSMDLYNKLIQTHGFETVEKFMTTLQKAGDIKTFTGNEITGENKTTMVYGAAALGPKIGNGFFMNLYGHFEQLTMDRWLMRTWGRWTGTLVEINEAQIKSKRENLKQLIKALDPAQKKELEGIIKSKLKVGSSKDLDDAAIAIWKASTKKATRIAMSKVAMADENGLSKIDEILGATKKNVERFSFGDEIRKLGNALTKYLDGQKEMPSGPPERGNIRKVFAKALADLQNDHPALTMSDFQALLWYPEKRLYDAAKTKDEVTNGYEDDEAPDYANAAAKFARTKGISEQDIGDTISRVDTELQAALSAGGVRSGNRGSANSGGVEGFKSEGISPEEITHEISGGAGIKYSRKQNVTSDEQAILDRISQDERKRPATTFAQIYQKVVDDLSPIKAVAPDAYQTLRLVRGAYGKVDQFINYGTFDFRSYVTNGEGLKEILDPIKNDLDQFRAYMVSRRAVEQEAKGKATGIPLAEANGVIAASDAKFRVPFQRLVDYQDRVLNYLRDSGVVSHEAYDAIKEANKNYVPFFRLRDEDPNGPIGSSKNVKNPIKAFQGSERIVLDPIESIIKNTYLYVELAERNAAHLEFADEVLGNSELEGLVKKVPTPIRPVEVTEEETAKFLEDNGLNPADATAFTIFRPNPVPLKDTEFVVYRDGKREIYETTRDIAGAVRSLDKESISLWMQILAKPASLLRAGATLSPDFILRNPLRDQFSAFILSQNGYKPWLDMVSGAVSLVKRDEDFQNWLKSGGANSALVSIDRQYIQENVFKLNRDVHFMDKVWNVAKSPVEFLRISSELMENATRIGEFKRAAEGAQTKEDLQRAGFQSREITLDFARAGTQSRALNMISAFYNAQVQGVDRNVRAFKDNPASTLAKVGVSITLPSVLLWMANHEDDRWKEIPSWQRDLFWIVMTKDHIYRIPKPFEMGVLFGSAVERALDGIAGQADKKGTLEFLKTAAFGIFPNPTPTAAAPILEHITNHSFLSGHDLVPARLEKLLPEFRYTDYTTETAKFLGHVFGVVPGLREKDITAPMIMENYVRQWTGGLGNYALQLGDAALRKAGLLPDPVQPTKTLAELPVIKAFMVRYPSASAESLAKFQEDYQKRKMNLDTVKMLATQGDINAVLVMSRLNPNELVTLDGVNKAISEHTQLIHMINKMDVEPGQKNDEKARDAMATQKRQLIDGAYNNMIEMARMGNKIMKDIDSAFDQK